MITVRAAIMDLAVELCVRNGRMTKLAEIWVSDDQGPAFPVLDHLYFCVQEAEIHFSHI